MTSSWHSLTYLWEDVLDIEPCDDRFPPDLCSCWASYEHGTFVLSPFAFLATMRNCIFPRWSYFGPTCLALLGGSTRPTNLIGPTSLNRQGTIMAHLSIISLGEYLGHRALRWLSASTSFCNCLANYKYGMCRSTHYSAFTLASLAMKLADQEDDPSSSSFDYCYPSSKPFIESFSSYTKLLWNGS